MSQLSRDMEQLAEYQITTTSDTTAFNYGNAGNGGYFRCVYDDKMGYKYIISIN